ncbi:hypothetical protein J4E83_005970 [Alternaria metachromatica]|uniref:uncharacterized protein n=1 Tax=Alternaria metachromatica TaxID=283354 RepID=UPI0020C5828C|nr:uncharacterized protein J4E83_005970 [Alternaria metachromatica]KAI4619018.1 hypothetical protein J4E83_005970 [Alternaria metachromatica]
MSDSEADRPSEATISTKLRDIVIAIHKSGKSEDLTVKRVRARAEKELALDEGFFKTDSTWKEKSQKVIVDAVEKFCSDEPSPQPTPKKAAPKPKAKPAEKKTKAATENARGTKRKAAAPAKKPKKRAKTESEESEAELSEPPAEISDAESEPPKKLVRRGKKTVAEDSDEEDSPKPTSRPSAAVDDESDIEPEPAKKADTKGDVSDSDLSSVIDEEPKKKKKAPAAKGKKEKAPAKPKAAPKAKTEDDPDTAEVKRLQGWLVKCGIRKVWSRDPELSQCDTSKDKIHVLKGWLKDVGMDGKYSVEKAAKIKEQREFAKDLEAIKEGEAAWGKASEVTATGRPSRRAAAKPVPQQKVVLEDDSEEEAGGDDNDDDDDDDDDVQGESEDEEDDKSGDSGGDDSE